MNTRAGITGITITGLLVAVVAAWGQTSPYTSMAIPGTHNGWNTTPSMALVANNTWVTTQTLASANGEFKFAANGGWANNWGGNASIARAPAAASAPDFNGGNLTYAGLETGDYRFTFNDSTLEFLMERVGGSAIPSITTLAVVGDFNGWTATPNSMLTNHPGTHLWGGSVSLENPTALQFQPDSDPDNQWGAPTATSLTVPVASASACGRADFSIPALLPGKFLFTLNVSNATFSIIQTETNAAVIAGMTVQGSFIATNNPPPNMRRIGDFLWESDHHITNTTAVTVRFAASGGLFRWGVTNGTPAFTPLPALGNMTSGLTNFATVGVNAPGRYRITFNHSTGEFSFRRQYTTAQGVNLLQNPGFETIDSGGNATGWGGWQSWPKTVSEGFAPHTGTALGAIHGQLFPDWTDYGSYAQTVSVTSGRTYRAAAWLKSTPDWTAGTMQIKIEWLDNAYNPVGIESVLDIPSLNQDWVQYAVEGTAPTNATRAHVVILCGLAGTTGTMHVDDVEFRAVGGRRQDFETWGALQSFGPFAPDWSVTSGRVLYNIPPGRPPAGVFISQYVEGTGNNKAIEIYNGFLEPLDLAAGNYVLQQYNNGALTPSVTIPLTGTIQPGSTLVVARPFTGPYANYAPDSAITGLPNLLTNKNLTFNGDDAIVLRSGGASGTVLDRVGQVGSNAVGSIWSRNTTDRTLSRKVTITTGTTTAVTAPFPADEWNISPSDTFSGLGTHDISYVDPNEPYTPAGYSLVMNSGATLMSGDMPGGVGDVSFWYRTESMGPPVTMVVETAPDEAGPWTLADTLEDIARSNFTYYASYVNRPQHPWMRIRQTDGGTNRFRIDEILVTEPSGLRRLENFNTWTDPAFAVPGNYSRYGWAVLNGSIQPGGAINSLAALISPPNGTITSPIYPDGVGEVQFWAKTAGDNESQLLVQTSIDGGSNWITEATFLVTTAQTFSTWLYITNPAQARIIFDPGFDSDDTLVDNVEIRAPILFRNQNFDAWPTKAQYQTGVDMYQGWVVTNIIVDSQNAYQGQVARFHTTLGNFVRSPEFPDGIGSLSFRIAQWPSDPAYTLDVQLSPNGVSWTTFTSVSAASTEYQQFSYFLDDTTNRFVRFLHSAGNSRVLLDDIRTTAIAARPNVIVTPGIDPAAPTTNDTVQILADVIPRNGASILSVTGVYQVAASPPVSVEMIPTGFGTYAAVANIPALPAGVGASYHVRVQYAGIGANPASQGYSTNLHVTATNTYSVSSIKKGDVWINEIAYLYSGYDFWEEDHEFIELCGVAGANISGWTIQLAFGADRDIAANNGNPIYASYKIPNGMVFTNQQNGFGFYVLGDHTLKAAGEPVNQVLTVTVPTNVVPWADEDSNHVHNVRGVIRLLNEHSNLVYSLSYQGSAVGSDQIPINQQDGGTNSVGLTGTGSSFNDFTTWALGGFTIGAVNNGQTLVPPGGDELAEVWHHPVLHVTPLNPVIAPFYMRHPHNAQSKSNLVVHYGFPSGLYTLPSGTLHHRRVGFGWSSTPMSFLSGSLDADDYAYTYGTIPLRTYPRAATIEYIIEADAGSGTAATFIGYDSVEGYQRFGTLDAAKAIPFTYTYQILPEMFIDIIQTNVTSWIFTTEGNEPPDLEPFTNFQVLTSTNMLTPLHLWTPTNFIVTPVDQFGVNVFTVPRDLSQPKRYYRIDPQWP